MTTHTHKGKTFEIPPHTFPEADIRKKALIALSHDTIFGTFDPRAYLSKAAKDSLLPTLNTRITTKNTPSDQAHKLSRKTLTEVLHLMMSNMHIYEQQKTATTSAAA